MRRRTPPYRRHPAGGLRRVHDRRHFVNRFSTLIRPVPLPKDWRHRYSPAMRSSPPSPTFATERITPSALALTGNTPLIALDRVYRGPGRILAKAEFIGP